MRDASYHPANTLGVTEAVGVVQEGDIVVQLNSECDINVGHSVVLVVRQFKFESSFFNKLARISTKQHSYRLCACFGPNRSQRRRNHKPIVASNSYAKGSGAVELNEVRTTFFLLEVDCFLHVLFSKVKTNAIGKEHRTVFIL